MSEAIPAATLILFRERTAEAPELLMIERAAGMAFAPGAMVFPGGRLDPGDHHLAETMEIEDAAWRIAAIRETIEEVGIPVGLAPLPSADEVAQLRDQLAAGHDFGALLAAGGWSLDLAALTPFARWRPNFHETRTFDTIFYLADAPSGSEAVADGGESVQAIWASAQAILDDANAGRHSIIFPTRRNLERLAGLQSVEEARAHAGCHPIETITPWIEEREGEAWLCIPPDRGYPVTAELLASARRR